MKVTFKKRRYYKGKLREVGDIIDMDKKHARAFIRVNAAIPTVITKPKTGIIKDEKLVEIHKGQLTIEDLKDDLPEEEQIPTMTRANIPNPVRTDDQTKDEDKLENLSYRALQELCKEKGLPANGTREELIERLKTGE